MNNKNKHTLIFGIIVVVLLLVFAVNIGLAAAGYKKKAAKTPKPAGNWRVIEIYNGQGPKGPFTLNAVQDIGTYGFEVTFKNKKYCTTHWTDPRDHTNTKPHCEPLVFNKDRTFTGSRLQAFGGFMKMNGKRLEFIEGGMGGFTKYVLQKKK